MIFIFFLNYLVEFSFSYIRMFVFFGECFESIDDFLIGINIFGFMVDYEGYVFFYRYYIVIVKIYNSNCC